MRDLWIFCSFCTTVQQSRFWLANNDFPIAQETPPVNSRFHLSEETFWTVEEDLLDWAQNTRILPCPLSRFVTRDKMRFEIGVNKFRKIAPAKIGSARISRHFYLQSCILKNKVPLRLLGDKEAASFQLSRNSMQNMLMQLASSFTSN